MACSCYYTSNIQVFEQSATIIFSLSSSHAAAILAVALVGYNSHIINEEVLIAPL
jgi:hypothetical protein